MTLAYLHVGMDKTGSTSLQRFLANAAPNLLEQGFYYPTVDDAEFGRNYQHAFLKSLLVAEDDIPNDVKMLFERHETAFFFATDWLRRTIEAHREAGLTLILSAEAFYSMPFHGILNLRNLLHRLGYPDLVVPIFIDSAANRYRGQTAQRIVTGRSILPPHAQEVAHYVHRLASVFGQSAVLVVDFREACRGSGHVQRALDIMGIIRPETVLETRENVSLSAEALHFIHSRCTAASLSNAGLKDLRTRAALVDLVIDGRRSPALRHEVSAAIDAVSTDYHWLAEHHGFSLPDAACYPAPALPECATVPDLFAFDPARYRALVEMMEG